jgi:hypothetical protein
VHASREQHAVSQSCRLLLMLLLMLLWSLQWLSARVAEQLMAVVMAGGVLQQLANHNSTLPSSIAPPTPTHQTVQAIVLPLLHHLATLTRAATMMQLLTDAKNQLVTARYTAAPSQHQSGGPGGDTAAAVNPLPSSTSHMPRGTAVQCSALDLMLGSCYQWLAGSAPHMSSQELTQVLEVVWLLQWVPPVSRSSSSFYPQHLVQAVLGCLAGAPAGSDESAQQRADAQAQGSLEAHISRVLGDLTRKLLQRGAGQQASLLPQDQPNPTATAVVLGDDMPARLGQRGLVALFQVSRQGPPSAAQCGPSLLHVVRSMPAPLAHDCAYTCLLYYS